MQSDQSSSHCVNTPPSTPVIKDITAGLSQNGPAEIDQLTKLLELLESKQDSLSAWNPVMASPSTTAGIYKYKEVDEVWDKALCKYKTIDHSTSLRTEDDCYQFSFVARTRVDRETRLPVLFIDIKSPALQQVLSTVLEDVRGMSVQEDKPTLEGNVLFSFLPELKAYRDSLVGKDTDHLGALLNFVENAYASTAERLRSLLERHEITYDLLWALFKPNTDIYTTCPGTEQPMCVRCNYGEEKRSSMRPDFYSLKVRYFDYDGKIFGQATGDIEIHKFRGTMKIDSLDAYPLRYHRASAQMTSRLIDYGRLFVSLAGMHHKQYEGIAFRRDEKRRIIKVSVKSKIMVDPYLMWQTNPNYRMPVVEADELSFWAHFFDEPQAEGTIKGASWNADELPPEDLLICSPTVKGFSLNDKQWLEFAVAHVKDIGWNGDSLSQLTLPAKQKKAVHALCNRQLIQHDQYEFDDFIEGKGCGLSILLHGPPGVGKTLTAEAMAEYLQRPLYSISAGELGIAASVLETRLSDIFTMADRWRALLLLDEADVYVEERRLGELNRNELVCVFLRKLEYYRGILILTTNRVETIDEAVASRIHLALPYRPLTETARAAIWGAFLRNVTIGNCAAEYNEEDVRALSRHALNGREIKNAVSTGLALATQENTRMRVHHFEEAIEFNVQFKSDFRGAGRIENMHAYQ